MNYSSFAYIYDDLMSDVNYVEWANYIEQIFVKYSLSPKLLLELACGTGNITLELSDRGYDVIGLDKSCEMLAVAQRKAAECGKDILFSNQDMVQFELYGTVDGIICMMDGINYLTDNNDVSKLFARVHNYLNDGGLFIFDIRTEYTLSKVIGNKLFFEDSGDVTYIWENEYNKRSKVSNMFLTFFVKVNNLYEKFTEDHSLKCYSIDEISDLVKGSGLELIDVFDNLTFDKPNNKSERIFFVVKKCA